MSNLEIRNKVLNIALMMEAEGQQELRLDQEETVTIQADRKQNQNIPEQKIIEITLIETVGISTSDLISAGAHLVLERLNTSKPSSQFNRMRKEPPYEIRLRKKLE